MTLTRPATAPLAKLARLALAATLAALAAGCAAPAGTSAAAGPATTATAAAPAPSAPLIHVPPVSIGTWYDLGHESLPWLAGDAPVPVSGATAPTRAVGLRRDDGHWLAIVAVQTAPAGSAACAAPTSLHVPASAEAASGCLRMRRDADFDHYLEKQNAVLWQWLQRRGLASTPRAWVAHRVPQGQRLLEVHALLDPALLEATTRSNDDFLAAGAPGLKWARQLARAAQAAADGAPLAVPALPFAPQAAPPVAPAAAPQAPPVVTAPPQAEQVMPPPAPAPVPAPRADRQ
ncbi:hypothetical protein EII20_05000 [Comamonadaceae bacterium OH2545_COT-014]|nr:hypothetical protein EII20_05000 [Comamonadaceae bacterium OH2545_COT-014]